MKKIYVVLVALFALAACDKAEETQKVVPKAPRVSESDSMPLIARENNCTACHAIDKKVVGPSWLDIANKYKGDAGAEARLITKVSKGGAGVWGSMPMPANDASGKKPEQMKELVRFILALAK